METGHIGRMGRFATKEHPKYRIVSVRISEQERELLHQVQKQTLKTVSEILRDALRSMVPQLEASQSSH